MRAAILCAHCPSIFRPARKKRDGSWPVVCPRCAPKVVGLARRGLQPKCLQLAGIHKTQQARVRAEIRLRTQFGQISDRDAAIFSFGIEVGYSKGYASAYHVRFSPTKMPTKGGRAGAGQGATRDDSVPQGNSGDR